MKMKKYPMIPASVLGLILCLGSGVLMHARNGGMPQTDQPLQQATQETKAFTGMIVEDGGKVLLKEMSSNTAYKVDDQKKVKDYVGKMVKITGTLDQSRHVIQIESVELAS